ncbi:phosphoribosylglycinamide formyltransferase, partial [Wolbachia endosymbiont of Drosophila ananassae]
LISGRGSNMQALIEACQDQNFSAEVACVSQIIAKLLV